MIRGEVMQTKIYLFTKFPKDHILVGFYESVLLIFKFNAFKILQLKIDVTNDANKNGEINHLPSF